MKRHLCRHCGLLLNMYAELRRHVETHATPSSDHHTYSLAPTAVVTCSDHAKRTKYACEKCGVTFGRWDNLQRHVRSVCSGSSRSSGSSHSRSRSSKETATYTCKKCGRNFNTRKDMFRHARTACTDVNEPPLPKRSKWQDTSPHLLVTEEAAIDPPALLPFSDTLSTELLDVVSEHWSTIRTSVSRGPIQCRYDYRLATLDTTVLR